MPEDAEFRSRYGGRWIAVKRGDGVVAEASRYRGLRRFDRKGFDLRYVSKDEPGVMIWNDPEKSHGGLMIEAGDYREALKITGQLPKKRVTASHISSVGPEGGDNQYFLSSGEASSVC